MVRQPTRPPALRAVDHDRDGPVRPMARRRLDVRGLGPLTRDRVCRTWQRNVFPLPPALGWAATMPFVLVGWVLFRAADFKVAISILAIGRQSRARSKNASPPPLRSIGRRTASAASKIGRFRQPYKSAAAPSTSRRRPGRGVGDCRWLEDALALSSIATRRRTRLCPLDPRVHAVVDVGVIEARRDELDWETDTVR